MNINKSQRQVNIFQAITFLVSVHPVSVARWWNEDQKIGACSILIALLGDLLVVESVPIPVTPTAAGNRVMPLAPVC